MGKSKKKKKKTEVKKQGGGKETLPRTCQVEPGESWKASV